MWDLLTVVRFSTSLSLSSHCICIIGPSDFHCYYCIQILQHYLTLSNFQHIVHLSGDDLFSDLKPSWSFANSDLSHIRHSLDSDRLPVPDTFQSSSYSEPLPAVRNTTMRSLHHSTSPDISSEGCSKTSPTSKGSPKISSDSTPSDMNSALTFSRYSQGCSGDGAALWCLILRVTSLE